MKRMTDYSKETNTLKVNLENFQSISKGTLEFVQGINIIVGQSNSGKSAILRAIKGTVLNPNGSQKYIQKGTDGFKVGIEYEGNSIEWARGTKSSPKYVVNGEEYLKVGSSNLTDVLDKSGFVLDEGKNLMNIESELELPFPFDKSNSELFKLFEKNIFCISDSTAIIKLIKSDEDETTRQKEKVEFDLDRYRQKFQAITELEQEISLEKLIEGRNILAETLKNKDKLLLDINNLCDIISMQRVLSQDITPVGVDNDILHKYITLQADIHKLKDIRGVGATLSKVLPTASTPVGVEPYIELKKDMEKLRQAEKLISILSPLEGPTTRVMEETYTSLRQDINQLRIVQEKAQRAKKDLVALGEQIKELSEEINGYKVCPLCGSSLGENNE